MKRALTWFSIQIAFCCCTSAFSQNALSSIHYNPDWKAGDSLVYEVHRTTTTEDFLYKLFNVDEVFKVKMTITMKEDGYGYMVEWIFDDYSKIVDGKYELQPDSTSFNNMRIVFPLQMNGLMGRIQNNEELNTFLDTLTYNLMLSKYPEKKNDPPYKGKIDETGLMNGTVKPLIGYLSDVYLPMLWVNDERNELIHIDSSAKGYFSGRSSSLASYRGESDGEFEIKDFQPAKDSCVFKNTQAFPSLVLGDWIERYLPAFQYFKLEGNYENAKGSTFRLTGKTTIEAQPSKGLVTHIKEEIDLKGMNIVYKETIDIRLVE